MGLVVQRSDCCHQPVSSRELISLHLLPDSLIGFYGAGEDAHGPATKQSRGYKAFFLGGSVPFTKSADMWKLR